METGADSFDSPWKDAIRQYLGPFLEFCFPEVARHLDLVGPAEFIEQELRPLARDSEVGEQRVDQLIRMARADGQSQLIYLHVEVQSQARAELPRRLYQYHYRLADLYGESVVTLCVLADASTGFRPAEYRWELFTNSVRFCFDTCKLLDFAVADLEASGNPIALVIAAHRAAQETKPGDAKRFQIKRRLVFSLFDRGFSEEDVRRLFRLVDWLLSLSPPAELDFRAQLSEYQARKHMPYITSVERIAKEEGLELGLEQGLELVRDVVAMNLEQRFGVGAVTPALAHQLREVTSPEALKQAAALAMTCASLDEFTAQLRPA